MLKATWQSSPKPKTEVGEKVRAVTIHDQPSTYNYSLTQMANKWVLDKILNVDKIVVQTLLRTDSMTYVVQYACIRDQKVVVTMVFDDDTPMEDRITAMQVALRMSDGNHNQKQEGGITSP